MDVCSSLMRRRSSRFRTPSSAGSAMRVIDICIATPGKNTTLASTMRLCRPNYNWKRETKLAQNPYLQIRPLDQPALVASSMRDERLRERSEATSISRFSFQFDDFEKLAQCISSSLAIAVNASIYILDLFRSILAYIGDSHFSSIAWTTVIAAMHRPDMQFST